MSSGLEVGLTAGALAAGAATAGLVFAFAFLTVAVFLAGPLEPTNWVRLATVPLYPACWAASSACAQDFPPLRASCTAATMAALTFASYRILFIRVSIL